MRRLTAASLASVLLAGAAAFAGEEKVLEVGRWYPGLESGLNFTQSAYSDNWNGGDKSSIVWAFITNAGLESRPSEKTSWKNTLKLAFGQTHQQTVGEDGKRGWDKPEKSTDLLDFETVFRLPLGWVVDPYVSGRFESQFLDITDPGGRTLYLNPLEFQESGGVARKILQEEERELLTRFGFTFRQSSRRFFEHAGADSGEETTTEATHDGGFEWVTDSRAEILDEKVTWTSRLSLYQPVFYSYRDRFDGRAADQIEAAGLPADVADYPRALDADWENIFTTQVTRYLSVNVYLRWIYDKYDNTVPPVAGSGGIENAADVRAAIRKAGQFKQTMSIALTYRFL